VIASYKEIIELLIAVLTLGIDVFFVGTGLGTSNVNLKTQKLFLIYVGLFHILFSFAAISIGTYLHQRIGSFSELIGGLIIIATGLFFFLTAVLGSKEAKGSSNTKIVTLAFAISTDCFSVGIGVSMHLHMIVGMLIGFTAIGILSSYLGIQLGRKIGKHFESSADIVGSLCLVAVGGLFLIL
jgi:manganese efflux pump family protein